MTGTALTIRGLGKRYAGQEVLDQIDLVVGAGEFLTLLGPSGCGKSTLLRLIAGFEQPDRGEIEVAGRSMRGMPTYDRPLTMMFQSLALFPNMNVADNVGYGLRVRGVNGAERSRRVAEALDLVGLSSMGGRHTSALSGGQRQRVALARCLVIRPALLLLDEPLAALDLQLRRQLQVELKDVQRRTGCAFIYVTHDQEEAMTMSDRIAVMRAGRIEQVGTPSEIYARPRNSFVANFVGEVNVLRASQIAEAMGWAPTDQVAIRPEAFTVSAPGAAAGEGRIKMAGTLAGVTQVGSVVRYRVDTALGVLLAAGLAGGGPVLRVGEPVSLAWRPADAVRLPE